MAEIPTTGSDFSALPQRHPALNALVPHCRRDDQDCAGRASGEYSIAELCRREGIADSFYYFWTKEFLEAGKRPRFGEPLITNDKIKQVNPLLWDQLHSGTPEFRQAYAKRRLHDVLVTKEKISISGSKGILAQLAARPSNADPPEVLSFVRRWRTRRDSNP